MNPEKSIGISLQIGQQLIDLQIPRQVTIARLKKLFIEALRRMQIFIPERFDLVVLDKPIRLKEENSLADYSISEGDQLAIRFFEPSEGYCN